MKRLLALAMLVPATSMAQDMRALDFLVDAKQHSGKEVVVRDCTIIGAMAGIVMCNVLSKGHSVGNIILDGNSMDRASLRRSLERCSDMRPTAACQVQSLSGRVRVNSMGDVRVDQAVLAWKKRD